MGLRNFLRIKLLKRKHSKPAELIPYCFNCEEIGKMVKLLVTVFPDGVVRFVCPECKRKLYTHQQDDGFVQVKGYEP